MDSVGLIIGFGWTSLLLFLIGSGDLSYIASESSYSIGSRSAGISCTFLLGALSLGEGMPKDFFLRCIISSRLSLSSEVSMGNGDKVVSSRGMRLSLITGSEGLIRRERGGSWFGFTSFFWGSGRSYGTAGEGAGAKLDISGLAPFCDGIS